VDAAARQLGAVGRFGHIRFGAEETRRLDYGLFEWAIFERVQRIVMDENADGTLHRQQVRRVLNGLAQFLPPRFRGLIVRSQPATAETCSGGGHPAQILRSIPFDG